MQYQTNLPGHVSTDQFDQMLVTPESFAAKPESLTEQLFVERKLTENRFWPNKQTGFIIILNSRRKRRIKYQIMWDWLGN